MNQKPVILTGIRANNDLHIGNYLGALLPFIDMTKQKAGEYQLNLFMPDLHSITTPIDYDKLQTGIMQSLKVFVAAGLPLDNENIFLYRQSYISAHSELTVILNNFARFGSLTRMTQFKEKSQLQAIELKKGQLTLEEALKNTSDDFLKEQLEKTPIARLQKLIGILRDSGKNTLAEELEGIRNKTVNDLKEVNEAFGSIKAMLDESSIGAEASVGLFDYPVLMACDILLYSATYVPVGDDQSQHLEFARDIAMRMNNKFGDLFTVPLEVQKQHEFFGKDQGLRIKDLLDPTKKMSKSDETGKGVIFMTDSPEVAAKKIMSATTDSAGVVKYDTKERPGISNLLQILALLSDQNLQQVIAKYEGQTSYGDLKKDVAKVVGDFLGEFQKKLADTDETVIKTKLEKDEAVMRQQANSTLLKVQRAVGLRPKE